MRASSRKSPWTRIRRASAIAGCAAALASSGSSGAHGESRVRGSSAELAVSATVVRACEVGRPAVLSAAQSAGSSDSSPWLEDLVTLRCAGDGEAARLGSRPRIAANRVKGDAGESLVITVLF